jgi:hypothetical protein
MIDAKGFFQYNPKHKVSLKSISNSQKAVTVYQAPDETDTFAEHNEQSSL